MSKKKKKSEEKKSISILKEIDKSLTGTYDDLVEEIQDMQYRLNIADQKARKKAKKHVKKGKEFCDYTKLRKQAREEVIGTMEGNNFLDRITKVLTDLSPIVILIARLVASLILAILSLDIVKVNIKPETLLKMKGVYEKAMSFC